MIKCVICSQNVTSRRGLAFHIKKHSFDSVDAYLEAYPEQRYVLEPKDETLLTCPICGRYNMKQLGQHITGTHKMTHEQFISMYPDQKMFIDEISDRCRKAREIGFESYLRNVAENPDKYKEIYAQRAEKRKQNNPDIGIKIAHVLRQHGVYSRLSEQYKLLWQQEEYRQKQSNKCREQHKNGLTEIVLKNSGKKRYHITLNGITYSMRSTWECKFAQMLHDRNIPFEYEFISIHYMFNDTDKIYYPDFHIIGTNIIFEVKPYSLTKHKRNVAKMNATIDCGYDFRYITEHELLNPNLIQFPDVK